MPKFPLMGFGAKRVSLQQAITRGERVTRNLLNLYFDLLDICNRKPFLLRIELVSITSQYKLNVL